MKYRYVAWDDNGVCVSSIAPPRRIGQFWIYYGLECYELAYDNLLRGKDAAERYYDMEDENDRQFIEALIVL